MDEPRSRRARALAELALVRLLHELREHDSHLIVLGGLVPEILAADDRPVPLHLGTTDVDILLITQPVPGADINSVERALERLNFAPDSSTPGGWRWLGAVDGTTIKLEFLCDLNEHREQEIIRPPGCHRLAALNLRGTGYVARDYVRTAITARLADGEEATVQGYFAGLEGYLLSKCVAARTRAQPKDYYDLVYVLAYNRAGGPEQAARRLLAGELADELGSLRSTFMELRERYARTSDSGPIGYAEQALEIQPDGDPAQMRADAVDVVQRFITNLNLLTPQAR